MCRNIRIKFLSWAYMYTTLKFLADKNAPKSNRLAMLAISLALRRVPDSLPACPFTRFLRLLT